MLFSKVLLPAFSLAVAAHGQTTKEFVFSPNLRIPESGSRGETRDDVTILDDVEICDLKLRVDIEHTFTADLEITLQHDATSRMALVIADDCGLSNDLAVTFSDDASISLDGVGSSNPLCSQDNIEVRPEEPLSAFDRLSTAGDWTLIVNDDAGGDIGRLNEWALIVEPCPTFSGTGMGDPHFQTWNHSWFDFHGACDLVYIENPYFALGTGLTIHVRTTARYEYSFIESAIVKIGEDTLQVNSYGSYFLNGISNADMPFSLDDKFPATYTKVNDKKHSFEIDLGHGQKIAIETYKDLVSVKVTGARADSFKHSKGLLGQFGSGDMLSRDGKIMEDANAFGNEWQVREPTLFLASRAPQYPAQCTMPSLEKNGRRRLGASIAKDSAAKACAHAGDMMKQCIFDVIATGDLEIANAF